MSECPRVLTKEQMIEGLKQGRTLCVDRRDAPELPELMELAHQGLVKYEFFEGDQYSVLKFRWSGPTDAEDGRLLGAKL